MIQIAKLIGLKAKAKRQGWIGRIRCEADERAMLEGCWFSKERAEWVERFFLEFLVHSEGDYAGQPVRLEPWQRDDLIYPLFGWQRANFRRRFRKLYCEIPKKNGKSFLCSALGVYLTCGDGEAGAKVYATATKRDQAKIVHAEAQEMVLASQALSNDLNVWKSKYLIEHPDSQSEFLALAAEEDGVDGINAHAVIMDELHRWKKRGVYNALEYAFSGRSQPLHIIITTAGDDLESICYDEHKYAAEIIDGTRWDSTTLAYIRSVSDPQCSILDEKEWYKANPNLGISIPIDGFRADARKAVINPVSEANFRRLRLNIWTAAGTKWMDPAEWKACRQSFDLKTLAGRRCFAGLDMSRTRDTTALVLIFPMDDGTVVILSYFWLPEETAKRQKDKITWLQWADAGAVQLVPGRVQDYGTIKQQIRKLSELYQIEQIAFDPMFADNITQDIENELGIERIEFRQTLDNFAPAVDEMERRILERTLIHTANPVLDWQILNTVMKSVGELKRPIRKSKDDLYKIDGTVATLMALRLVMESDGDTSDYQIRSL